MCFLGRVTHISRDLCFPGREHMLVGICVSWMEEHILLGLCVSWVGEHISLGICVSWVLKQISLGMCLLGRGTRITRDILYMCRVFKRISLGICFFR